MLWNMYEKLLQLKNVCLQRVELEKSFKKELSFIFLAAAVQKIEIRWSSDK
jgi:hypothetical protein